MRSGPKPRSLKIPLQFENVHYVLVSILIHILSEQDGASLRTEQFGL